MELDRLARGWEIRNLFIGCMANSGFLEDFIERIMDDEESLIKNAVVADNDKVKKEAIELIKNRLEDLLDEDSK